ncbi:MAG: hypothetical protein GC192_06830 [Bacteroidetes bacterium]|nr:hypothetical protein [Bacteroidota bacterium]
MTNSSIILNDRFFFIQTLFGFLASVEYVWLKAVFPKPEETPEQSDIDLLVHEADWPSLLFFISKQACVTHCEATRKNDATYLRLQFQDGSKLKLDLLSALVRKQFSYLPNHYLLANLQRNGGIVTYTPQVLLEHVLFFNFLNHAGLPPKYVQYFGAMSIAEQKKLVNFINVKYGTSFADFQGMSIFKKTEKARFLTYLRSQPENRLIARIRNYADYLASQFWNKKIPTPRIVTFSGVDGAGKSTLLNDLKTVLTERLGQRVVTLRHRPSLLPILSAITHGKQAAEARATTQLPRQGNNGSTLSSLLRFGYYYADYFFGQVYIWLRYLLPGYTVVYDRYYFDFIVDGKRSNISLSENLPRFFFRFLAKPGLNIFLHASPDTILQRKKELPRADIEQMTMQYMALFEELKTKSRSQYICIENLDRMATLETILAHYFLGNLDYKKPMIEATPSSKVKASIRKSQIANPTAVLESC